MNPCPCGYLGHPDKNCTDTPLQIDRYRSKISGPLWDRIDMHITVPALRYAEITGKGDGENSLTIRTRVTEARKKQHIRFGRAQSNAEMSAKELGIYCTLDAPSHEVLRQVVDNLGASTRTCGRILRVSRTIADLAEEPTISRAHLLEAVNFRNVR